MEEFAPATILGLLRREDEVFRRLENLASRQRDLVVGADMGLLLGLLEERRKLSSELAGIERNLGPARREWHAVRVAFGPQDLKTADELMSRAGARLRRLMEQDEVDARKLSIRKQAVGQTLQTASVTAHALSAYQRGGSATSRLDYTETAI